MQFNFNCEQALGCDKDGVAILEGSFQTAIKPGYFPFVNQILDSMGYNSSQAQGLNTIITTASKFFSSNHRIFIKAQGNLVIGLLKVGVKKLFVRDEFANYHEISPLCVLDFYVHESQQRGGHGKPKLIAYDRPSPKLVGFLKKHYGLSNYVAQNNNFVIFNDYFENRNGEGLFRNLRNNYSKGSVYNKNNNLANLGQQLINTNNNNNIENNLPSLKTVNRDENNNSTPNLAFANHYLNGQNSNYYDQIYSKKKLNMLTDYLGNKHLDKDEYVKEQLEIKGKEINNARERVRQLENNIHNTNQNYNYYNKRNEYYTVFDDKKILEKKYFDPYNNNNVNQNELPYVNSSKYISDHYNSNMANSQPSLNSNRTPIKTNILPTTSSTYGACYNTKDFNNYSRNIYY